MTQLLLVVLGAAVGAPLRYLTDRAIQAKHDSVFPWGTMTVNVAGSALLGLVAGLPANPALTALLGTGFCGALTTYSTFSYETLRLAQDGARFYAVMNVVASLVAGLGAASAGLLLAQALG
ncbi:fluoride efflux transporter CrcB [Dactylosporangium sp. CA-092794]|uniref:fluoride efflux transporter CrcB n=1 Tax=Dactylosporangium sp. CA-092794 TaxID=3239929 RepID=UPI003D92E0C1